MRSLKPRCAAPPGWTWVLAGLLIAGCPPPQGSLTPDAGADAGSDAGTVVDAGPTELRITLKAIAEDAGIATLVFEPGIRPFVDPVSQLELSTNMALTNYRVRLFDDADRVVISDDQADERADRVDYRIRLPAPLRTGRRYALQVDPQGGPSILDGRGHPQADVRLEFQVSGEKEKTPKKTKSKKRRH